MSREKNQISVDDKTPSLETFLEAASSLLERQEITDTELDDLIKRACELSENTEVLQHKTLTALTSYENAMNFFASEALSSPNSNALKAHMVFSRMHSALSYLIEDKSKEIIEKLQTFLSEEKGKESCSRLLSHKIDNALEILNSSKDLPERISDFKNMVEENRPSFGSRILEIISCILNGRRISEVVDENPFKPLKSSFWNKAADTIDTDTKEPENQTPRPK